MSTIIVLAGGTSGEREVSLRSGAAVVQALQTKGHSVTMLDPAENFLAQQALVQAADLVFPALHGSGGEDGELQKILESWRVPFVGSDARASALCFDKWQYKQYLLTHGILMPRGELVDATSFAQSELAKKPFVLKPHTGGSSIDTLIVRDVAALDTAKVADIFARHPQMLLEELIDGSEITVGILGEEVLPVIEIIPPSDGEFDYNNKYNGRTQELCPPQHIATPVQESAQALALKVHRLCGCRDLSRNDFMVTKDGELYLLETNTIPGLTDQSLFPKAAATSGLSMAETAEKLVFLALARA